MKKFVLLGAIFLSFSAFAGKGGPRAAFVSRDLRIAIENSDLGRVQKLLNKGADPNLPLRGIDGASPLFVACERRDLEIIKALLEHHALTNTGNHEGTTPLMDAVIHHRMEVIKTLLEAGVHPGVRREKDGKSPLMFAAELDDVEAAEVLWFSGEAYVDHYDQSGETALFYAVRNGNVDMVSFLLKKRANPDHSNFDTSETPRSIAHDLGNPEILKLFSKY